MNRKSSDMVKVPDIEGLEIFAFSSDRATPPRFVGRTDELKVFQLTLNGLWKMWRTGKPGEQVSWMGETFLFQGAPGAGKTAMLGRLEFAQAKTPECDLQEHLPPKTPVRVCDLDLEDLKCSADMKRKIARTFFPLDEKDKELDGKEISSKGGGAGFNPGPLTIQWMAGKSKEVPASVWDDIKDNIRDFPWGHEPVLVMADEVQNLGEEASDALDWLHKGKHGLPIIPVFGGLAWSAKRLDELGISRKSLHRVYTLKKLSGKDCMEAVQAFFDKYKVIGDKAQRNKWAQLIAEDCMGWPQHLHAGMQGLAEALVLAKGLLADTDREFARKRARARRNQYYNQRLGSPRLKSRRYLATAAVERLTCADMDMTVAELGDEVEDIHTQAVSAKIARLRLPAGMSGEEFAETMLQAGLLHEHEETAELNVPIPCFTDYMINFLEKWRKKNPHIKTITNPSAEEQNRSQTGLEPGM